MLILSKSIDLERNSDDKEEKDARSLLQNIGHIYGKSIEIFSVRKIRVVWKLNDILFTEKLSSFVDNHIKR